MKVYVARQPIFDNNNKLYAYELLYRNSEQNCFDQSMEGNRATRLLLSDVITVFNLDNITNRKYAFVNFTKELILDNLPDILDSKDIVIEILEDVVPDKELIECIIELKKRNFKIALDDYTGPGVIDALLKYSDIVKVDFRAVQGEDRFTLAKDLLRRVPGIKLLAEKVETKTEVEQAKEAGYTLFQGYFYSKPAVLTSSYVEIADTTGIRLFNEINKENPDYAKMAGIVRMDVGMSYTVLKQMNTMSNYRGKQISDIQQALVRMGIKEIRRMVLLIMMRNFSSEDSTEISRIALTRAVFAEYLVVEVGWRKLADRAFFAGMFSMIDVMLNEDMFQILDHFCIYDDVKEALMGTDNELKRVLMFTKLYEEGRFEETRGVLEVAINEEHVAELYINALNYADKVFDSLD